MIKIGITGSIASGKTTASKIISKNKGPLFSADKVVKKLYSNENFRKLIAKKLNIKISPRLKSKVKDKIIQKKKNLRKIEKIIHPLVRKEMFLFFKKYKNKRFLFFEIPLLIESNLGSYFDVIVFIRSKENLRLKRYRLKGGTKKLFAYLNNYQLKDTKKMKFCDHIVVNNKSLSVLKKQLLNIIKLYE